MGNAVAGWLDQAIVNTAALVVMLVVPVVFVAWWATRLMMCPQCGSSNWLDFGRYRTCYRCGHYQSWHTGAGAFVSVPDDDPDEPTDPDGYAVELDDGPALPAAYIQTDDPPGTVPADPYADIPDGLQDSDGD